jgi:hypothetical protein
MRWLTMLVAEAVAEMHSTARAADDEKKKKFRP